MNISTNIRPRIHFTKDHEWVDFNGTVGFVGVSAFKLSGIRKIDRIQWAKHKGTFERGALVASIISGDKEILVHAPVTCKLLGPNAKLQENPNLIIQSPEDQGWIFFITPLKFQDKSMDELLQPSDYKKIIRQKNV